MPPPDEPLSTRSAGTRFPDRAIRRLLEDPQNLRNLLADLLPNLVDRFDFAGVELLPRTFVLDDWRRREADMFFRLPFRDEPDAPPALVCVLVEHQSQADPAMPLRVLIYAVLYWQEEWKAWETEHPPGEPLRLSPIIPVVLHTAQQPWRTHRRLAELIGGPEMLRAFAPDWQPLLWELAERTPEELAQAVGEWLAALAVVRAERADAAAFREVFVAVLRRLERLSETERVRWHDLLWFVLSWALRRRPGEERDGLLEAAQSSQADVTHREEVRRMSETIAQTWEQELIARGEARGEARGQLREARSMLRLALTNRFGALSEALLREIDSVDDLERLHRAFERALEVSSLAEFTL